MSAYRRTPTPEQQAIIDAYRRGGNLVIEAGAGTGKTTTLKMLAAAKRGRRGLYIAYNKAIADDAKRDFPQDVKCATAHSLAFGAVGRQFKHRLNGSRLPAREVCKILNINDPVRLADDRAPLAPNQIARLVMETVARFCRSADPEPSGRHIPKKPGIDTPEDLKILREVLVPYAAAAWQDLTRTDGRLRFEHDHYLKMWQLSKPKLPTEYVLLDEAQDANPVIADIVNGQDHAQRILVGDRSQSIYGWRGAVDAMETFPADHRLALSQSFRFGAAVAREANKWLGVLGAELRLTGFDRINSMVTPVQVPDAMLCRSNSEAVAQAMNASDEGRKVALVGGGRDIRRLAEAAVTLKAGTGTDHPELFAFQTWGEVQDYAENDPSGTDLKVFVKLIDSYGPDMVIDAIDRLSDERGAHLVMSTAHKAKGREWDSVKIAGDFREPKPNGDGTPGEVPREEAMLAYVAVTRARLTLDRGGLAWIDKYAD